MLNEHINDQQLDPEVDDPKYREAVERLLPIARDDTGGSKPAATVLLSAYNGYRFALSIPDLRSLDPSNFTAALTVIVKRGQCFSHKPHQVIPNGSDVFEQLAEQWAHLSYNERGAS